MNIYIVRGTSGEYSDRKEWPILAFSDEWEAEKFMDKLRICYEELVGRNKHGSPTKFEVYNTYNSFDHSEEYEKRIDLLRKAHPLIINDKPDNPHPTFPTFGVEWFVEVVDLKE